MFRAGLRMLLNASFPDGKVIEAASLNDALQCSVAPGVVLLDIKLQGLNGIEGIALIKRQWPQVPILMLSSQDEQETVRQALSRGATDFISKADTADRITAAINGALSGEGMSDAPPERDMPPPPLLTPRQYEVLDLLCQGLSNKLIARRLDLSENTVRWHVQAILSALNVSSRAEAAFTARRLGLVD